MIGKNFINLNFHTVPFTTESGFLERLPTGGKTLPRFEKNYRDIYSDSFNKTATPLMGALTGQISGFIAIDCDNDLTFEMFKALDPSYTFHFIPIGKGGGTILYKYVDLPSFSVLNEEIKLDLLSNNRLVYLPTENNKTKKPMLEIPCDLKEPPANILAVLKTLASRTVLADANVSNVATSLYYRNLCPIVAKFVSEKKFMPDLFKIITPMSFRSEPQYALENTLNPKNIKQGKRSIYLMKISAILGADPSIDLNLYRRAIEIINNMLGEPLPENEISETITSPMMEGRSKVNGKVIWKYDEKWRDKGFSCMTMRGDFIESFFDDFNQTYYVINNSTGDIFTFADKRRLISYIKSLTGEALTEPIYDSKKRLIRTIVQPDMEFGHTKDYMFNLFRQNQYLNILNNSEIYSGYYKKPNVTLKFLETFIPSEATREFLIRFLKTKLTTFGYSPIIIYFLGVPGSGKDTFVSLIRTIIGDAYCERPESKVFLEKHNGWMKTAFLAQLDEYGEKAFTYAAQEELLGRLKSYTGSPVVQIRSMNTDAYSIQHRITFILTSNKNSLRIMPDDRRFLIIDTPNKLNEVDWVKDFGGISEVIKALRNELKDFCYYLAQSVRALPPNEYVEPPYSEEKIETTLASLAPTFQIQYIIQKQMWARLIEMAETYNVENFTYGWSENRLFLNKLYELYQSIVPKGDVNNLRKTLTKNSGLALKTTQSVRYGAVQYFHLEGLDKHVVEFDNDQPTNPAKTVQIDHL